MTVAKSSTPDRRILYPETRSRRPVPLNLRPDDLPLFESELERTLPPVELRELRSVRISADGLLLKGGRILDESFPFPFLRHDWRKRAVAKVIAQNYLMRPTRSIDEEVVWVTDSWSLGYFHWLADVLCKLEAVEDLLCDRVLLLPHDFERLDFVRKSLEAFAVTKVQFIGAKEVVKCARLLCPTPVAPSGHFREDVIRAVRKNLVDCFARTVSGEGDSRIYVSRSRATKRRIANEGDVIQVLQRFGFKVIHAEDLSFAEQVRLFAATRYFVSNHGAGLTNMLLMPPASSVLELRHQTDSVNNAYFVLAAAMELNYFYQLCEAASTKDAHYADLIVDTDALENNLKAMLGVDASFTTGVHTSDL